MQEVGVRLDVRHVRRRINLVASQQIPAAGQCHSVLPYTLALVRCLDLYRPSSRTCRAAIVRGNVQLGTEARDAPRWCRPCPCPIGRLPCAGCGATVRQLSVDGATWLINESRATSSAPPAQGPCRWHGAASSCRADPAASRHRPGRATRHDTTNPATGAWNWSSGPTLSRAPTSSGTGDVSLPSA